jgi:hypothetical protein
MGGIVIKVIQIFVMAFSLFGANIALALGGGAEQASTIRE